MRIAQKIKPGIQVGEYIVDPLPPIDFGRIGAQTAKQVIVQRVREVERKKQFEEYKDRVGEIVNGTVKRTEYGNLMVDLGRAEALLRRDETIPREAFKNGDRVRAYIAARIRASSRSSSRRKCPRSTTASSRSRLWRATPARAPRWR